MTARLIYEKLNLKVPGIEQRRFFNWLNDTIDELRIMYKKNEYIFVNGEVFEPVKELDDELNIRDLFAGAIVDNLLYYAGAGDGYKSEFIRKSELAYNQYYRENKQNRIIRKMRW